MGFRFRKRIRIVKGLYLNLGKAQRLAVIPPGEAETHPEANPLALIRQLKSPARAARYISGERHLSFGGAHEAYEGFGLLLGHLYAENPLHAFLQEAYECINSKLLNPNTFDPDDLAGIIDIGE
jgi:hypothetical protein